MKHSNKVLEEVANLKRNPDAGVLGSYVDLVLSKHLKYLMIPSSMSGRYHPPDEFAPEGQSLHVLRCLRVLDHLTGEKNPEYTNKEKAILRAALLVHDLDKISMLRGDSARKWAVNLLTDWAKVFPDNPDIQQLIELVSIHGGPWYSNLEPHVYDPTNKMHVAMHYSDYIASRSDIKFNLKRGHREPNRVGRLRKYLIKRWDTVLDDYYG